MKYQVEFRNRAVVKALLHEIRAVVSRPWVIMEICGGQTHAILRNGIEELLPPQIQLIHGPGCPVCVTPVEKINRAIALAEQPDVILVSFGDMLRVPGSEMSLSECKSHGGDIRMVYSPLDALSIAEANTDEKVVFFAVGFETTAPLTATAIEHAFQRRVDNFHVLTSHLRVVPAMRVLLESPLNRVQGLLAPGHVCAVTGYRDYLPLVEKHHIPIAVTGFEPVDILAGILDVVRQLEAGQFNISNCYGRIVNAHGNAAALAIMNEVLEVADSDWRGLGLIPKGSLKIRSMYSKFDAELAFCPSRLPTKENRTCISGEVLQGFKRPFQCPAFANECNPEHPLGAPMVSSEGACAAYYRYRKSGAVS